MSLSDSRHSQGYCKGQFISNSLLAKKTTTTDLTLQGNLTCPVGFSYVDFENDFDLVPSTTTNNSPVGQVTCVNINALPFLLLNVENSSVSYGDIVMTSLMYDVDDSKFLEVMNVSVFDVDDGVFTVGVTTSNLAYNLDVEGIPEAFITNAVRFVYRVIKNSSPLPP